MRKILLLIIMAALMINVTGCSNDAKDKEQAKLGIRGQITKVIIDGNKNVTSILVEGKIESDTEYDKANVKIDKDTKIYKEAESNELSVNELKEGIKVEVVFEGPIAESYPVQGKAKTIRLIE